MMPAKPAALRYQNPQCSPDRGDADVTTVVFRRDGKPVPITGTIRCSTCGMEVPAESVVSVEHGAAASKVAITHPPGHKVSFNIESPDAVNVFMVDAR
jgi:hypothetical protein